MPPPAPRPGSQRISQFIMGHWSAITLATAVRYSVFTHIERGVNTPEGIAMAAGTSVRGTQALLDGLVAFGLLAVASGRYINTPEAGQYLVEGKPGYMGGATRNLLGAGGQLETWGRLPDAVMRGGPDPEPDLSDADAMVVGLAQSARAAAQQALARLDFATRPDARLLDVGGGAGAYSAVFLTANPTARATQVDGAKVNAIALDGLTRLGVADRFEAIDGDLRHVEFGEALYDVAVLSQVAHIFSPEDNLATFRRIRRALKPGGTLVLVDFIVADQRGGPPFPLLFALEMLLLTRAGGTYRESDYRQWLGAAGFKSVTMEPTQTPATLVIAR